MFEVAHSGEQHRDAQLVRLLNRILVTHRATWLNNSSHAILSSKRDSVIERKETVRSENESLGVTCRLSLLESNLG
jgi:seryl-tRNA(Sec) selenium transferase